MDPSGLGRAPQAPPSRLGQAAIRMAQAAAMAAVVALGVTALSFFPHPRRAPLEPAAPEPRVAAAPALRPRIAPAQVSRPMVAAVRPRRAPRAPAIAVVAVRHTPDHCRTSNLAADRLVCSEPGLASLDRRMRAAYAQAIAAGADRLEIDRSQARWHGARDRATEAGQIERLYARRIADLEAAAARPPRRRAASGGLA